MGKLNFWRIKGAWLTENYSLSKTLMISFPLVFKERNKDTKWESFDFTRFFIIQPEKVTLIALYTISKKGNYELHKEEMSLANVLLVWYQIN